MLLNVHDLTMQVCGGSGHFLAAFHLATMSLVRSFPTTGIPHRVHCTNQYVRCWVCISKPCRLPAEEPKIGYITGILMVN